MSKAEEVLKPHFEEHDIQWRDYSGTGLMELLPCYVSVCIAGGGRYGGRAHFLVCSDANARESYLMRSWKNPSVPSEGEFYTQNRDMAVAVAEMIIKIIEEEGEPYIEYLKKVTEKSTSYATLKKYLENNNITV